MIMAMSRDTGKMLTRQRSIRESIEEIATTPIGTRLIRRDYGSLVPFLIDQPLNELTQLRIVSALIDALARWVRRVDIAQIDALTQHGSGLQLTVGLRDARSGTLYADTVNLAKVSR